MSVNRIAYRYAKAFFDQAKESGDLEEVIQRMSLIAETINNHQHLKRAIQNPSLALDDKLQILESVFSEYISGSTLLFLKFLGYKKRINIIDEVVKQLEIINRQSQNIVELDVTLSSGLDESFGRDLEKKLSQVTGLRFDTQIKYDQKLIGGFTYSYEGSVFDCSIKGKLDTFQKQLNK